ncbi:hypothetical protein FH972_021648 [Carpinus fangiana]|uniref:RING-CH-type domain-containing protein n=1 Tax=Carpinus fangiana TaxID=176857 RepID=A0A5N6KQH6_9ROSI|nr:hypothetical protein FH972_021648 [Carpinus fangiana]
MASFPQRQHVSRRASPTQASASAESTQQLRDSDILAHSTTSVDSQTLYLNDSNPEHQFHNHPNQSHPQPTPEDQPRQCWICLQDETEDTAQSSSWRSPCPCTLTAHEKCLLEWADDTQRQKSSSSISAPDLVCPMCQAEIILARPHARLTKLVHAIDVLASKAVIPSLGLGLIGSAIIVASHHGAHSIRMIFGPNDAEAILAPRSSSSWLGDAIRSHLAILDLPRSLSSGPRGSARLRLGLPLIPVALVASRTPWADSILPFFPIALFAVNSEDTSMINYQWPPSAALTIATLPYLRVFYGELMDWIWTPREHAWLQEIRPSRQADTLDAHDAEQEPIEGHEAFEVELELNIEEDEIGRVPVVEDAGGRDARRNVGNIGHAQAAFVEGQGQHAHQPRPRNERQIAADAVVDLASMCKTVIGALLFPSISAAMGEVLRQLLPRSWVVPRIMSGAGWGGARREVPSGLLQTRWGRSIVGGCLAVVLKDAVRIYCRWRMAQSVRTRTILDFDKQAGRTVGR